MLRLSLRFVVGILLVSGTLVRATRSYVYVESNIATVPL